MNTLLRMQTLSVLFLLSTFASSTLHSADTAHAMLENKTGIMHHRIIINGTPTTGTLVLTGKEP